MTVFWGALAIAAMVLIGAILCRDAGEIVYPNDPLASFSNDDVRRAALELVWPVTSSMRGSWGNTLDDCDRAQKIVDEKRKRFANYEPPRMRRAIKGWLDFEDHRIAQARADITSGASVARMQEYDERRAKEEKGKAAVLDALKKVGD